MKHTAILILAAGNSSRLGRSKQLLSFRGKTLLQQVTGEAVDSGAVAVFVILGANAAEVSTTIRTQVVGVIENENWSDGLATGIVKGMQTISCYSSIAQVIIAVCDQPFLSATIFQSLVAEQERSGKGIVASGYAHTVGTPVLFTTRYFNELMELKGEEGAKKLIGKYSDDVSSIAFPEGYIDIDTPADYERLLSPDSDHP